LQQIPMKHDPIASAIISKYTEVLEQIEREQPSDPLTDWRHFEVLHSDKFLTKDIKPIVITWDNHPKEGLFSQFQVIRVDNLEIYHKVDQYPPAAVTTSVLSKRWSQATTLLSPKRREYGIRGAWSVSTSGHLIEYDPARHELLSMYNLSECQLRSLEPDALGRLGYFALTGSKMRGDGESWWKQGKPKEYKFRAPLKVATELHRTLGEYCGCGEMEFKS
jgi:hypothetical protein